MICKYLRKAKLCTLIPKPKYKTKQTSFSAPPNWEKVWIRIKEMRGENKASCDNINDILNFNTKDTDDFAYQSLICAIIMCMTRGDIVNMIMQRLKENDLSIHMITQIEQSKLEEIIKPVAFHHK